MLLTLGVLKEGDRKGIPLRGAKLDLVSFKNLPTITAK